MRKFAKTLSRILCSALSVCTILSAASIPAMAFPRYDFKTAENTTGLVPATEVLFYENFETDPGAIENSLKTVGAKIGNGKWEYTNRLNSNKRFFVASLKNMDKSTVGYTLYMQPHGTETIETGIFKTVEEIGYTGNYSIEFSFMRQTAGNVPLLYGAGYSTKQGEVENYAIQLYVGTDNKLYYKDAEGNGKEVIDTRAYKVGNKRAEGTRFRDYSTLAVNGDGKDHYLYNVKIDIRTAEKKYDLYLNGSLCAENVTFMNAENIESINVPFAVTPGTDATIRYDEMKVYREPVGVTTLYANDFSKESSSWSLNDTKNNGIAGFAGLGLAIESGRGHTVNADGSKIFTKTIGSTVGAGLILEGMIADDDVTYDVDFTYTPDSSSDGKYAPIIGVGGQGQPGIVFSANKDGGIYWSKFNGYSTSVSNNFVKIAEFANTSSLSGHFTMHVDFINANCDLYLDNKLIAKDLGIVYNDVVGKIENGAEYWLCLGNYLNAKNGSKNESDFIDDGSAWDNLRVSRNVRENILADVLPTADKVTVDSEIVKVQLPTTAPEGYSVEWSSNNSNFRINSENGTGTMDRDATDAVVTLTATVKDNDGQQVLSRTTDVTVPERDGISIARDTATSVQVTAYNAPATASLIAAVYDSSTGQLKYVDLVPCTDAKSFARVENMANGVYKVKGFVLDLKTLVPIWAKERSSAIEVNQ